MGTINTRKTPTVQAEQHLNWMGGAGYFLSDPVNALKLAATSSFFGEPMYYQEEDRKPARPTPSRHQAALTNDQLARLRKTLEAVDPQEWRSLSPPQLMEQAIDKALAHDPERTLAFAAELRNEHHIRTTPQVILVRAANRENVRGTGLIRRFGPEIIQRADEPAVGLAYQLSRYGADAPIPNSLKRAWAAELAGFDEYQLAKYRMEDRSVKTVDVVNLVRPNGEAVGKLVRGELKVTDRTWEGIISKEGSSKASWEKAVGVMGHMALLRNLRNLHQAGVDRELYLPKLKESVKKGKQLPFRYYSAHKALAKEGVPGPVLDAVEECLVQSLENLPRFHGRVMSLCDNSGSAWSNTTSSMGTMHIAEIANLTGVIGGLQADEGYVGIFGDRLEVLPVRQRSSVFDQVSTASEVGQGIGASTENGIWLFWDKAIREKQHWDHVFVFSDMQAGHGGLYGESPTQYKEHIWSDRYIDVSSLVNKYRSTVNPNVNVYLVQVAGYQDTILPEFYKRTYILSGWGDGLFRFAHEVTRQMDQAQAQQ
jgi:hypothetical protein